jgi:phosphotransferase system enzyme I (PtsI)
MVEIPSAAIMADAFAKEADFFSIGTNDLCQYTMAADRTNAKVADLADFLDPAVLNLIRRSIDAADRAGIPVAMCGEMAGSVVATPLLLGMGLKEFSMSSSQLPEIKDLIRRLSADECRPLVDACTSAATAQDVHHVLQDFLDSRLSRS